MVASSVQQAEWQTGCRCLDFVTQACDWVAERRTKQELSNAGQLVRCRVEVAGKC